jgi:flagellar basal-body rod protein FlgC
MSGPLFGVMRTIGSGLSAQRRKMESIASNVANAETTRTEDGLPYRKKSVVIKQDEAVITAKSHRAGPSLRLATRSPRHISKGSFQHATTTKAEEPRISAEVVEAPPDRVKLVYDPHHPDADADGYVAYPDINPVEEMVDMMTAARAYEANIAAMDAFKSMVQKALEI